jgi:hypothetical protein
MNDDHEAQTKAEQAASILLAACLLSFVLAVLAAVVL